jgi:uncharacterized protein DUF6491
MEVKMKKLVFAAAGLVIGLSASSAVAGGLPEGLEDYQLAGETKNCVSSIRIDRTSALDDRHILFEMRNNKVYLNRLRGRCSRLGYEDSFMYKTTTNQVCNGEIITVLHNGDAGASCSLGKFELLEEVEASEDE